MIVDLTMGSATALARIGCSTLWRISWQAGFLALAVAGICRALPRLSASTRCWLWRAVLLKFALCLLWPIAEIPLPLLPAMPAVFVPKNLTRFPTPDLVLRASKVSVTPGAAKDAESPTLPIATVIPSRRSEDATTPREPIGSLVPAIESPQPSRPGSAAAESSASILCATPLLLIALYGIGVARCVVRITHSVRQTRRFVRLNCRPLEDPHSVEDAVALSRKLGIRRIPRLMEASDLAASALIAALIPIVVLPLDTKGVTDREARRLMLAHELAHLRRRDLWWSALGALARTFFFFHPLVWLAFREEELAREMACDSLVLATTSSSPARYGALLVQVTAGPRHECLSARGSAASLGMASEVAQIRYRLLALRTAAAAGTSRRLRLIAICLAIVTSVLVIPWRVVAAARLRRLEPPVRNLVSQGWRLPVGSGVVEGRVLVEPDGTPGANCAVDIASLDFGPTMFYVNNILTDADGCYRIDHVPAGKFQLSVRPYCEPSALVHVAGEEHVTAVVGGAQHVAAPDLKLTKSGAMIFGRVVDDQTGQPVAEVQIGAVSPTATVFDDNIETSAAPDGSYTLHLTPGENEVFLHAAQKGHTAGAWTSPYRLRNASAADMAQLVDTVKSHRPFSQLPFPYSQRITVRAGQIRELDFRVHAEHRPAPANSYAPIIGRVVDPSGRPVAGADVYIFTREGAQITEHFAPIVLRADARGAFRLEGLSRQWAGTRLDIRARDTHDDGLISHPVYLTLPSAATVASPLVPLVHGLAASFTGRVIDGTGEPFARAPVAVDLYGSGLSMIHRTLLTDASGRYHQSRIWPDMTASVALAGNDLSQRSLAINGNRPLTAGREYPVPLLTAQPLTRSLTGICVNAAGKPLPNIGVTAFAGQGTYSHGTTDDRGRFRLDTVEAGTIRLCTSASGQYFTVSTNEKDVRLVVR